MIFVVSCFEYQYIESFKKRDSLYLAIVQLEKTTLIFLLDSLSDKFLKKSL